MVIEREKETEVCGNREGERDRGVGVVIEREKETGDRG